MSKTASERISPNLKTEKSKSVFNCWLQRDLTIIGRILLAKADVLSRFVYPTLSLYVDRKTRAAIDSLLFKFIRKHKTENTKRKTRIRCIRFSKDQWYIQTELVKTLSST